MENNIYYEGTEVLINNFNIKDKKILNYIENKIVTLNMAVLHAKPLHKEFNAEHYKEIHKFLFSDIYEFAGDMNETEKTRNVFKKLQEEEYLGNIKSDKNSFSGKLAEYMIELGNSRSFHKGTDLTTREFVRELSFKNGYHLDFTKIDLFEADKAVSSNDINKLGFVLREAIEPIKEHRREIAEKLIRNSINELYKEEFPAIKHVSDKTCVLMYKLNKENEKVYTVKELKKAYIKTEVKAVKEIVKDLEQAYIKEEFSKIPIKEQKKETKTKKVREDIERERE